jgi:hypothetical protein
MFYKICNEKNQGASYGPGNTVYNIDMCVALV